MSIQPSTVQLFWAIVETIPSPTLLALSDTALVEILMKKVSDRVPNNPEDTMALYEYINSRLLLIRDITAFKALSSMNMGTTAKGITLSNS